MKYIILFIIIFSILVFYRLFVSNIKNYKNKKNDKEEIIELKKDPKTNEYKPKE